MIVTEMDAIANPLSVLIEKGPFVHEKPESDPSSAFIDYNGWMTNDFNFDTETVLSPCKTMSSPSDQPQVLEWAPHEGHANDTISVILEQPPSEKMRGPIKIAFGQQVVDTSSHTQSAPMMEEQQQTTRLDSTGFSTTWITLTAKVPLPESIPLGSDPQVSVSLWFYDYERHDLVIDTWAIGAFTFLDLSARKKRSLSSHSIEDYPQKRSYQVTSDSEDPSADSQLLQLLAPYKDPLVQDQDFSALSNGASQNDHGTALWIAQQLQQQQPQHTQKSQPPEQLQQRPPQQQSNQQQLVGNMNSINTSFMDNLSVDFSTVSSNGLNVNQGNYYRQNGGTENQNMTYDGFSNTAVLQRNGYTPNTSINRGTSNQYNNHYQDDRMNYQGRNGNTVLQNQYFNNSNNNSVFSPAGGIIQHNALLSNSMNNNTNYHNSGVYTNNNGNNTDSTDGSNGKYSMASVHPFAGLLNKANLKICGDLMEMTFQWSAHEWHCGRRLVRFWRRQNTNNVENSQQVECRFQPIEYYAHHQEQQQHQNMHLNAHAAQSSLSSPISPLRPGHTTDTNGNNTTITTSSLVVSCIYWREQNDYFITSVDCIYLLEGLIGVQFTVEEKNRIRRNLEGFRPLTVSKCKTDCADFFKLIMGFPHPKPRNIEKDVKVFAWKVLPQALRKIIRKYTPNYSNLPSSASSSSYGVPPSSLPSTTVCPSSASPGNPSPGSLSSHLAPAVPPPAFGQQQHHHQQQQQQQQRNNLQQRQYCY